VFAVRLSTATIIAYHPSTSIVIAAMSQSVRNVSVPNDDLAARFDAAIERKKAAIAEVFKTTPEAGMAEVEDFRVWGKEFRSAWVRQIEDSRSAADFACVGRMN
jgi:hypothetical protein